MNQLSVQQYTFRPWSNQQGLFPVLEEVSAMGYSGLELCCFGGFAPLGLSAGEFRSRLADLGMTLIGNLFTREMFEGSHEEAFSYIAEAGGRYAVYNIWGSYDTRADVLEKADYLNGLSAIAQSCGITLLYHNHADEFAMLEDKLIIDHLDDALDPQIGFVTDVFFVKQQGCDPCSYLRSHPQRVRAVHLKQIDATGENVDLADGVLDMAEIIRSAPGATDFILEQSSFTGTIAESLRRNAAFLKTL